MPLSRSALFFIVIPSVLVALISYRFFFLGLTLSFPGLKGQIDNNLTAFTLHVVLAPAALILGAVQLLPTVRKRASLHRWVGRLYGLCVLVAGVAGFFIGISAEGGLIARVGFIALACAWIAVTAIGISHARARRFAEHRQWMMRSFALTFAGVMLRLQLLGFSAFGVEYLEASPILAWSSWVPNLIIVEAWLRRNSWGDRA